MLSGARPHAHLVDHRSPLVFARVPLFLRLLVLPLSVVQYAADRRAGVGVNLYEVDAGLSRAGHGVRVGHYPHVLSVRPYETDLLRPDPLVYPKLSENALVPLSEALSHD